MTCSNMSFFVIILVGFNVVLSEKLPEFIEPCAQNDTNINECFINNAMKAIPELVKGIDYLKLPILSPLFLKQIELVSTDNLELTFNNLSVKGLEKAKILNAKVDLINKTISTDIYFDKLEFIGTYLVNGKILILPIRGNGPAEISFGNVIISFYTEYELLAKNATDYINLINSKLSYTVKSAGYQLKDLFNGDAFLGEQTNKFLNENWEALHQEFSPIISDSIKRVVLKILTRILNVIPFNEIFIP